MTIEDAITTFVTRLRTQIEGDAVERARAIFLHALGMPPRRGPGRPPKTLAAIIAASAPKKPRKKAPVQLCPVPGCKNKAAPIFGMVCAKHKDVPKAKIKKYRDARRARKATASA